MQIYALRYLQQTAAIITKYTDQVAETLDIILLATFGEFLGPSSSFPKSAHRIRR